MACQSSVQPADSVQAEDKEGETPLSAAAAHGKLRDVMVAVAKGESDPDEMDAEEQLSI